MLKTAISLFCALSISTILFADTDDKTSPIEKYTIRLYPDFKTHELTGSVVFTLIEPIENGAFYFHLSDKLSIDKIISPSGTNMNFSRDENRVNITLEKGQREFEVFYHGSPILAQNPPWDGGVIWQIDEKRRPWFSVACEGIGASSWWPCLDEPYAEPIHGVDFYALVDTPYVAIANGLLMDVSCESDGRSQFHYRVIHPINLYNVNLSVGHYTLLSHSYPISDSHFPISYSLIDTNIEMKVAHLDSTLYDMLNCFRDKFGEYPFWSDSYKLTEVPFLGMEHQSDIAYGNGFQNGYLGTDLSGSGVGENWDFIVVHESGHEWWGNNVSASNPAYLWIHEGFTTYSEVVFSECRYGREEAFRYARGVWKNILNDKPIIGDVKKSERGSADMYSKGSAIVHMIRMMMDDDEQFWNLLRHLQIRFGLKTISSKEIEDEIISYTQMDLHGFFDQYLRSIEIPKVNFYFENGTMRYKVYNANKNLKMKIFYELDGERKSLLLESKSGHIPDVKSKSKFHIDPNYLIEVNYPQCKLSE